MNALFFLPSLIYKPAEALDIEMSLDLGKADASFLGENTGDYSGGAVASVGDVNGDGYDDILIGADGNDESGNDAGQIYLIFGRASGWAMDIGLSNANASFRGEGADDMSGSSVAGAGDVNGDGFDDFLIRAPGNHEGGTYADQIYLIFGKASGWSMDTNISASGASFWGVSECDMSGIRVAGAGDVNGDGYDDFLIAADYDDLGGGGPPTGKIYLIFGKSSGWSMDTNLSTSDASFWGGEGCGPLTLGTGTGDVNGDGYDDFLIGVPGRSIYHEGGVNYLIFGKASGWMMNTSLSTSVALYNDSEDGDGIGRSMAIAGDVNGDGIDDILIGDPGVYYGDTTGKTYLIFGKRTGWSTDTNLSTSAASFLGENEGDWSGFPVAGAGDVNGDGYDDILIGAVGDRFGNNDGHTYLILGKASGWFMNTTLSMSDVSFQGENEYDYSGYSLAGGGDVNGDGCDDILIGATGNDESYIGAGQTYLLFGRITGWAMDRDLSDSDASFKGENVYDYSGSRIAVAGDVNGDGYDDILIGAPGNDEGGYFIGQTYLIFGKGSGWTMGINLSASDASFRGENERDNSGFSVAGAGDVNGDGYDDILIGATGNKEGGYWAGQTYLILGKASGWSMDTDLSASDASFWGENEEDESGYSVAGAGDVNGDGYDDILIGAPGNRDGGNYTGQTYLIFGKATGWTMDTNLSASDASFWGEGPYDNSGSSVTGGGDVNGDGFDDILIGASLNSDGGFYTGQTYLILGRSSGWEMDTTLSNADASFIGENIEDISGDSISGAGDVNGDGYDDILIGVSSNNKGGYGAGQTYLIFGKTIGWAMDTNLSASDASFLGEETRDWAGYSVDCAGDVNGDGYDDILIGAWGNTEGGEEAGESYLILGKSSGWTMDNLLSNSDASFLGDTKNDQSGRSVAGGGDINGDGHDDIVIGAPYDDVGGISSGQTYLIFPYQNSEPTSITSIKAYSDDEYSIEISYREPSNRIYLELTAKDEDFRKNIAQIWVRGSTNPEKRFRWRLHETGYNTGMYRGFITIANRTHSGYGWIDADEGGWVEISSVKDPTVHVNISVERGIYLEPKPTNEYVNEDEFFSLHFNTTGVLPENWTLNTNADWLFWDEQKNNLEGTPMNLHVGSYWVDLRVEGYIYSDEINFTITVNNAAPSITTQNEVFVRQDQLYQVDYISTDDDQGNITWHLTTNATWLSMNTTTGVLNGTPTNEDVGAYLANVSVSDGNGGWDHTEFTLTVGNVNDPPVLFDEDVNYIYGNKSSNFMFSIMYMDIDGDEPVNVSLILDGVRHAMRNNKTTPLDFKKGVLYSCPLNLSTGFYQYYYLASDGRSTTRFPEKMDIAITLDDSDRDYDGDGYNDTYEREMGSDPYNRTSTPLDWDGDGWNNSIETETGADPRNSSSLPRDQDNDGIPDSLDPDRDGDKVANVDDAYPDDPYRWEDETGSDKEGDRSVFIWVGLILFMFVVGVSVLVIHVIRKKRIEEDDESQNNDLGRVGEEE